MSIKLREGESLRMEGKIHWISYKKSLASSGIALLILIACFYGYYANNGESQSFVAVLGFSFAVAALSPMFSQYLQNKCTKYLLTNQRLQTRQGFLSRISTDLPLNKINDISLRQSLLQR